MAVSHKPDPTLTKNLAMVERVLDADVGSKGYIHMLTQLKSESRNKALWYRLLACCAVRIKPSRRDLCQAIFCLKWHSTDRDTLQAFSELLLAMNAANAEDFILLSLNHLVKSFLPEADIQNGGIWREPSQSTLDFTHELTAALLRRHPVGNNHIATVIQDNFPHRFLPPQFQSLFIANVLRLSAYARASLEDVLMPVITHVVNFDLCLKLDQHHPTTQEEDYEVFDMDMDTNIDITPKVQNQKGTVHYASE
eukprot:CAMPEP_0168536056 /NCGR_PEP_ID=MMETSP0405-20121227/19241_1 /TAXON_ID=498012 /ORGANISM="Trichosphaerium sp, Strain Am-I-7 wt" /LENGTH=251 /DNA_ID=CAMNT_0008563827 /DNA_START=67 /DNA_END=822 /DNA_ORIENTATION=-